MEACLGFIKKFKSKKQVIILLQLKGWEQNRLTLYVEFWAVFIFCSDLPNFWYVSYKLVGKHLSVFCFIGFLFIFEK